MTIVPDLDLQSALNDALNDAFPTADIAWENTRYTPTVGSWYFRVWMLPAETDRMTLGTSPFLHRQGIFQVSVIYPIGIGFGAAKAKAAEVIAAFKTGDSFVYNGLGVIVEKSWIGPALIEDEGWYFVPVRVRYRCYYAD